MENQCLQTELQPMACEQIFGVTSNSSLYRADVGELGPLGVVLAKGETEWERWCRRERSGLKWSGPCVCLGLSTRHGLSLLTACFFR